MHHDVPPEIGELLDGVRAFVEHEVLPLEGEHHALAAADEVTPEFYELCRQVQRRSVEAGYHAMFMPEDVGGAGLGEFEMCLVRELISSYGSRLCMLMLGDLPFGPNRMLHALGTEYQREKFLLPLVRGEVTTAIALSEPDAGSDLTHIMTSARRAEGGWVLNGTKCFITNGPFADFLQVLARDEDAGGHSMFLVERDAYRVGSIQHSMAGDDFQAEIVFADSFVPEANVVGEPGGAFDYALRFLSNERLAMASVAIGMAEHALRLAKEYARQRVTFGKPLIKHQAIAWMIADSETELYAARAMTHDAARRADAGEEIFREISMAKLFASEMVGRVVDRAVQIHGGMGYMRDSTVERLYRLARVLRIAGGSSEIQRMIIASSA